MKRVFGLTLILVLTAPAFAQDSVSNTGLGLPGDALSPWDTTEQINDYVVDLAPITTSWGNIFGFAPIVKSSKTSSGFFSSLVSAQAISTDLLTGVSTPASSYARWTTQGAGINDLLNNAGSSVDTTGLSTNQFSVTFAEFATTDAGEDTNNVISAIVNYDADRPGRLYVRRVTSATNGANDTENCAQIGLGSVDADGNTYFRSDDFGLSCGNPISGDNVFRISNALRSSGVLNVIDNAGASDTGDWLVVNSTTTYNTPGNIPASIAGRPVYAGTNFDGDYAYESAPSVLSFDTTHLGGRCDHRGNVFFSPTIVFPGTVGTVATLGKDEFGSPGFCSGSDTTTAILLWGVMADGSVSGTLQLDFPATITDNSTGFVFPSVGAIGESVHHSSQTAFRGGNGQVALGQDQLGNILVSFAVVDDSLSQSDNPFGGVAVARFDASDPFGTLAWTMASYYDITTTGKDILDGPGGLSVGRTAGLFEVTGGIPLGPSNSSPSIDSVGNIWFTSAAALDKDGGVIDFDSTILRAVYDPTTFSYELEKVAELGTVFNGINSDTDYQIQFFGIADSNSVDSGTTFSHNIRSGALNNQSVAGMATDRTETNGGFVFSAEIVYDVNDDGIYDDSIAPDEGYNALIYISGGFMTNIDNNDAGSPTTITVNGATPNGQVALAYALGEGTTPVPTCGGATADLDPATATLITIINTDANGRGSFTVPVPGAAAGQTIWLQAIDLAAGPPCGVSNLRQVTFF